MIIKGINTYQDLSNCTNVSVDTIKSWFCKKKNVTPRLKTLDKLCNGLQIHTSDLFIPNSSFDHSFMEKNNSQERFIENLNKVCQEHMLLKPIERYTLFFPDYYVTDACNLYYSYINKSRTVPIYIIDQIVDILNQVYDAKLTVNDLLK